MLTAAKVEIPQFIWNLGVEAVCDRGFPSEPSKLFLEDQLFDVNLYQDIQRGDIVWLPHRFVEQFVVEILPNINCDFVLLISDVIDINPDLLLGDIWKNSTSKLIANPFVVQIFMQNYIGQENNSKLSYFPVGVDYHTIAYKNNKINQEDYRSPRNQEIDLVKIIAASDPTKDRKKRIFLDCYPSNAVTPTSKDYLEFKKNTEDVFTQLLASGLIEHEEWAKKIDLWKKKAEYAFSINLYQNELDCHRIWEDLVLGCIVIIKSSPLDPLYEGLPVVIIKDWSEVTQDNLDKWLEFYGDVLNNRYYREKLTHKYWYDKLLQPVINYRTEKKSCVLESYSLTDVNGIPLDHKLIERLKIQNGIFVEVGAYDGITQSNTALLEKYFNWTGLLIEPSKGLYRELCINRPYSKHFQCALGSFEQDNTYIWGDFVDLMGSVKGKRLNRCPTSYVLVRSLQALLTQEGLKHVNFFSLDTEGYEYEILKGIDFNLTKFDYMLIEIYVQDYDRIVTLLDQNGYAMLESFSMYDHTLPDWDGSHNDYLFIRKDLN
jgi:FkbM family methyltransferase